MNWGSKLCMKTMADVVSLRMFRVCCHCSPMEDEKERIWFQLFVQLSTCQKHQK